MIKECIECGKEFTTIYNGHNALYCCKKCKNRYRYGKSKVHLLSKEEKQTGRRLSYLETKKHPDRYEKHLKSGRVSRKKVRDWLADYKVSKGCIDCGYNKHSAALQIDHLGKKTAYISDLRTSILRLEKEIKQGKCVVRCAICHAVKTWATKNSLKYRKEMAK